MLLSLGIVLLLGYLIGKLFTKLKIPSLIGMILIGILIGPKSGIGLINEELMNISAILRQIALIVIITRAGLSLDLKELKKMGRSAFLMCFVPAILEIVGTTIFAPLLFDISIFEAMLLGACLGAVSPAIIVPRMIKLQEEGYNKVSNLVLTGASLDDIVVIILFYGFLGLVKNNEFSYSLIYELPLSIILGLLLGIIIGYIMLYIYKKIKINNNVKLLITLSLSFIMIGIENILKPYLDISALLGIMIFAIIIARDDENKISLKSNYNNLWLFFEIILFVLVGAELELNYALNSIPKALLLFLCSLTFRSIGVLLCLIKSNFNFKEKIFIIFSYLPKATVQASIGGIALSNGLDCGVLILTISVLSILITAPIGAFLIDKTYDKLLTKV